MPRLVYLLLFGILIPASVSVGQSRQRELFDFDWKFVAGEAAGASGIGFDDSGWEKVDLPHDWSIAGPIAAANATGGAGGFFPAGVGWYRKMFQAPAAWAGKQIALQFDGVYMDCDVYLNGLKLGNHPYGYTPFEYDLTRRVKIGLVNTIAVRVDNSKQINSRWYSGSGIYRHVWMDVEPAVHVGTGGIQISTAGEACTVRIALRNDGENARQAAVSERIFGPDGRVAGSREWDMSAPYGGERNLTATMEIANPQLWSPDSPALYRAVTTVSQPGGTAEYETAFGIRRIEVSAMYGLQLNGKRIVLCGACIHHDNGCLGAAAFDRAEERKVALLKAAGFNAIRTAHNPPSAALLDACDRLGMLVMDEAFDCWEQGKNRADYSLYFGEWWRRDLDSMILRDRNHPSVAMWSLGNELPDAGTASGIRAGGMLADRARALDPTRPLTAAIFWYNGMRAPNGDRWRWRDADALFGKLDVAGYNYQLPSMARDHRRKPDRVMLSSESHPGDAFACWQMADENPFVIGDFVWTGMDYLGESGIGRYYRADEKIIGHGKNEQFPYHGAYCGDLDLTGERKPISHYRNIVWDRGEKLYTAVLEPTADGRPYHVGDWGVLPSEASWTWPGCEGKELSVQVYSRCERVRLYLNGELLGERATTEAEEFRASFSIPYVAGTLKTLGLVGGKIVAQNTLETAGPAVGIRLRADRASIAADGEGLCFVTVEAVDAQGQVQPGADEAIGFLVSGSGRIAGVGSGDLSDEQAYQGNQRRLFHGRAQVVIRSARAAGVITLRASGPGLSGASTQIDAVAGEEVR